MRDYLVITAHSHEILRVFRSRTDARAWRNRHAPSAMVLSAPYAANHGYLASELAHED